MAVVQGYLSHQTKYSQFSIKDLPATNLHWFWIEAGAPLPLSSTPEETIIWSVRKVSAVYNYLLSLLSNILKVIADHDEGIFAFSSTPQTHPSPPPSLCRSHSFEACSFLLSSTFALKSHLPPHQLFMREFLVTTIGGHMLTQDSDLTPSLPPFVTLVCKSHSPPFLNCEPICWTSNISCDQWACHIVGLFSSRKIYSLPI